MWKKMWICVNISTSFLNISTSCVIKTNISTSFLNISTSSGTKVIQHQKALSWKCHESIMKASWKHHESIMKASWKRHESVMKASWKRHESVMKASWKHHESVIKTSWKCHESRCLKMLEDAWRCLKTLEDAWWFLVMHDDIKSIMHLIKRHHPYNQQLQHTWNQQSSSMESASIIHGINKHHVINKCQECYSIIDNIASLIATFKRYALVLMRARYFKVHPL